MNKEEAIASNETPVDNDSPLLQEQKKVILKVMGMNRADRRKFAKQHKMKMFPSLSNLRTTKQNEEPRTNS